MSDNPNEYRVPKRINDPILLWFFPVMHVMPIFFAAGASVFWSHFTLYFMLGGFGWYFLISYIDARYSRGYLLHKVWATGITKGILKETKTVADPVQREYFQ